MDLDDVYLHELLETHEADEEMGEDEEVEEVQKVEEVGEVEVEEEVEEVEVEEVCVHEEERKGGDCHIGFSKFYCLLQLPLPPCTRA